ncbi:ferritin-like protein [Pedobacter sp. MR2016-19]|uniref:ferritin-like domain-containing protein n=1 Tax=Pedobacter sp. MR2016-19 TaxID=2780089 RepID=UPI0018749965|nr:ferritin-like protein [Pedobacter sp. MR2016-19]MBE5320836.1 ferritin-like protein [Pedobacter sp. MR2016-19]
MQNNFERFLKPVFQLAESNRTAAVMKANGIKSFQAVETVEDPGIRGPKSLKVEIPYEFNAKDYLSFLLYINAEIEHGLMLQYLYAGYSIGGSKIPEKYQQKVKGWQDIILGIAKEEMGHFISVQNVLKLIGAPLNFGRMDYPWDTPFYPFPFKLERLTLNSLAKYVYAESPEEWINSDDPIAVEVKEKVYKDTKDPHRVGALFTVILSLLNDSEQIPDELFQANTYPFQAKFDEWGRGYTGGQRGSSHSGPKGAPDVLVAPLTCRDDAYAALLEISEQGEAPTIEENADKPSHFERFLFVYKELRELEKEIGDSWEPSRNVATNPFIAERKSDDSLESSINVGTDYQKDAITNPEARAWAHLFNVRYRMLLNYLAHSFLLDNGFNNNGATSPRATIINATFGEMYNLRSISNVLVQTPLNPPGTDDKMAGPPFSIPYTLDLPMGETNRWREHQDLIDASETVIESLIPYVSPANLKYLYVLREADQGLSAIIKELISTSK